VLRSSNVKEKLVNRLTIAWTFVAAGLAVSCASGSGTYAGAEDITYGSWGGTIAATGGATIDISYVIKQEGERQSGFAVFGNTGSILLPSSEDGGDERQAEMTDIEWDGTTLEYSWTDLRGTQLRCGLVKQTDTLLSGDCLDPSGAVIAQMTMSPPAGRLDGS
jgi:hypothetical protein